MTAYWKDRVFVLIQLGLFLLYVLPIELFNGYVWYLFILVAGFLLAVIGFLTLLTAIWQLRYHLSPFPTPLPKGSLVQSGIFQWVRHPIYAGILALTYGWALYTSSYWKLIVATSLYLLFYFKARYEEQLLAKKYPDYPAYSQSTGRFMPRFFQ